MNIRTIKNYTPGTPGIIGVKHNQVKCALDLIHNRRANPEKLFVIEGLWAHEKILESSIPVKSFLYCPELIYSDAAYSILERITASAEENYRTSEKAFNRICERDRPDGLISICRFPKYTLDRIPLSRNATIVILDGLEIPGNIGSLMRTVDGAGGNGLIICNRKARLTNPKILRASHGMNFMLPIVECAMEEIIPWLTQNKFSVFLADANTDNHYYKSSYSGKTALVLGNEKYGISKEWENNGFRKITIPMKGLSDSLNVAVAGSIILYHMCRRKW